MAEAAIAAVVMSVVVDKDNSVWAGRKLSCSAIFGCHSISHQIAFNLGKTALKKYSKVFICCRGYYQNWQIFGQKFTKQNLSFITATIQGRLLFKGGN